MGTSRKSSRLYTGMMTVMWEADCRISSLVDCQADQQ